MKKITKFKIFRNGLKVTDGSFWENEILTRKKAEQINILSVHFSTFKNNETRSKYLELLVIDGIDDQVEKIKDFFNYKVIFEDEVDFEKIYGVEYTPVWKINLPNNLFNIWDEKRKPIEEQSDECVDFVYDLIS